MEGPTKGACVNFRLACIGTQILQKPLMKERSLDHKRIQSFIHGPFLIEWRWNDRDQAKRLEDVHSGRLGAELLGKIVTFGSRLDTVWVSTITNIEVIAIVSST